jgi:hypothetical protein
MMHMGKDSVGRNSKNKKPQEAASDKLHFLLDTIETEVTDLAEVVELKATFVGDGPSSGAGSAAGSDSEVKLIDGLDLDMDFSGESGGSSPEVESAEKKARAALDAMSDAEGEIEAMLAEEKAGSTEDATATVVSKEEEEEIAQALKELLSTRELDASNLLKKVPPQKQAASEPSPIDDELSEDLFDDLDLPLESEEDYAEAAEPAPIDDVLSEDLLVDLDITPESEEDDAEAAGPAPIDDGLSEDLFADLDITPESEEDDTGTEEPSASEGKSAEAPIPEPELDSAVNREGVTADQATASPASEAQLADLLTKKIEALVIRLVEEQLSAIAERVIREKISNIFESMK